MDANVSRRLLLTFVISLAVYAVACFSPIAWSPDSRWLAFTVLREKEEELPDGSIRKTETHRLWLWDMTTERAGLLVESPELSGGVFAPDGKRVVFLESLPDQGLQKKRGEPSPRPVRLVLADADGRERTTLAELPPLDFANDDVKHGFLWDAPSLSPDGSKIAFSLREPAGPTSYLVEIASRKVTPLAQGAAYPRWSPDGNWICLLRPLPDSEKKSPAYAVEAVRPDGLNRVALGELRLVDFEKNHLSPSWVNIAWRPDSAAVAYTTYAAPKSGAEAAESVWLAGLDGKRTEFHKATRGRFLSNPVWSPDGRCLVISDMIRGSSEKEMGARLLRLEVPGGEMSVIAESWSAADDGQLAFTMPSWSPDGRWIAVRVQGLSPAIFSADGKSRRFPVFDENSVVFLAEFRAGDVRALEKRGQYADARKEARALLSFLDENVAKAADDKTRKALLAAKLYPLLSLNRFEDVIALGGGWNDHDAVRLVRKAYLALGRYDQVEGAGKIVQEAQELERKAAEAKDSAAAAGLWLQAGNLWADKLFNGKAAVQAFENVVRLLPGSPEAKQAQENMARLKARFEEGP